MIKLGIETSCDETAAAVVKDGTTILSNIVASSADLHAKTGGIIPEQAARQQIKSIIPVINSALSKAKVSLSSIDAIAVTVGPGLIGSLLVGVETTKTLSLLWKKPIVAVNHMVGHLYANWLDTDQLPNFPALALVVSGGHTDLVLMKNHGDIKWIGGTRDDAAGEAFDKTARLLGLPYPGGPAISEEAEKYFTQLPSTNNHLLKMFPRPMIDSTDFDFSFSGLKTSVLHKAQNTNNVHAEAPEISANVQEAIVDVLVTKTARAITKFKPKSLLVAGGVAANKRLRESVQKSIKNTNPKITIHIPPPNLCTDNAAYIASCAYFNNHPVKWHRLSANPQLTITDKFKS